MWRGPSKVRLAWLTSGGVAILAALPYMRTLHDRFGQSGALAVPGIRRFYPIEWLLDAYGFTRNQIAAADLLFLPLNYFLEWGVWLALALLWLHRIRRRHWRIPEPEGAAAAMVAVSLLTGTFLRSSLIANNDLGWRSLLIAQLILVIWSVTPMRAWLRLMRMRRPNVRLGRWRRRIALLAGIGLATSVCDVFLCRTFLPLVDAGVIPAPKWSPAKDEIGARTLSARQLYEQLGLLLPSSVVLQANPNRWNDMYHGLYGLRQTACFDYSCGSIMGGDPAEAEKMRAQLVPLFNDPARAAGMDVDRVCDRWGIGVLIAKDDDPVYGDRSSWVWKRPVIALTSRGRAFACGASAMQAETPAPHQ
jgi:hypothetical protein